MLSHLTTRQSEKVQVLKTVHELYVAIGSLAANGNARTVIDLISRQHYQYKVIGILQGFWEETSNDTLLVQVVDNESALEQTIEKLKEELGTDAVWAEDIRDKFQ